MIAARDRWVARGVSTTPLVVARADGARIWDVDGREYLDFAGGIACANLGHGHPRVLAAIREQVDAYLHQCFMVGLYEPYVEVCRRLAELFPGGAPAKSLLVTSGAEALENAVKIARAATGRAGVVVFDNGFHGRTLLTLAMTGNIKYKRGFGPLPADVYRVQGPYPYRGVSSDDSLRALEEAFARDVDPAAVACVVLEPVQGEGGFIPMPEDFPRRLREVCDRHGILFVADEVQSGTGRTGPVWAIEHYGVAPDLLAAGKSLGGGLPLGSVTGRAEVMDAVAPGGLGGTFGGNPAACAAAIAVLDEVASPAYRRRADELAAILRTRLGEVAAARPEVGEARGLGAMQAVELVEQTPALAQATIAEARSRGLVLLACGLHANVLRLLVPLVISDEDLRRGLDVFEESLAAAAGG